MSDSSRGIFFNALQQLAISILKLIGLGVIFCLRALEFLLKRLAKLLEGLVGH
ncbi:MAG: hypothetical protein JWO92_8 [Chitinophagaceae bacterium]|nr:hypothetical protein [Chitinophagaceae bacterium]